MGIFSYLSSHFGPIIFCSSCVYIYDSLGFHGSSVVKNPSAMQEFSSVQSLSRVQLCDLMDCSTPGFPVYHQLLELAQTHVHQIGDAIQPSHPLSMPSPPALNPSQHQSFPVGWLFPLGDIMQEAWEMIEGGKPESDKVTQLCSCLKDLHGEAL